MTFGATFGRVFSPTFQPNSQSSAAAVPWYLSGGIAAANCIVAYQPKGAASLAASYVNLANPGTYNAEPGSAPSFDTTIGWTFTTSTWLQANSSGTINFANDLSIIFRFTPTAVSSYPFIQKYDNGVAGEINYHFHDNKFPAFDRPWVEEGVQSGTAVTLSANNVCALTADGTNTIHYLNGSAKKTDPQAYGTYRNTLLKINSGNNFAGNIVCIAFYNTVLTPTQVGLLTTAMNLL